MARYLTCRKCGKRFNAEKIEAFQIGSRSYIHLSCRENEDGKPVPLPPPKPKKDIDILLDYCKEIYGDEANIPIIKKQITAYKREYGYTESGILKTLKYFYEVEHGDKTKARGCIGIVPYAWGKARDYYYQLYLTEKENEGIESTVLKDSIKEININIPEPRTRKSRFTFVDTEDDNEWE